ncbi:MAG: hypothetical protein K2J12_08250 [Muribaculaceae bacterium]|nr:hypothetical protein [Muribaculaceae bacterium]
MCLKDTPNPIIPAVRKVSPVLPVRLVRPAPTKAKIATLATTTRMAARRRSRETIIATCKRGRAVRSLWKTKRKNQIGIVDVEQPPTH